MRVAVIEWLTRARVNSTPSRSQTTPPAVSTTGTLTRHAIFFLLSSVTVADQLITHLGTGRPLSVWLGNRKLEKRDGWEGGWRSWRERM